LLSAYDYIYFFKLLTWFFNFLSLTLSYKFDFEWPSSFNIKHFFSTFFKCTPLSYLITWFFMYFVLFFHVNYAKNSHISIFTKYPVKISRTKTTASAWMVWSKEFRQTANTAPTYLFSIYVLIQDYQHLRASIWKAPVYIFIGESSKYPLRSHSQQS
jgi:hypothetical protein